MVKQPRRWRGPKPLVTPDLSTQSGRLSEAIDVAEAIRAAHFRFIRLSNVTPESHAEAEQRVDLALGGAFEGLLPIIGSLAFAHRKGACRR